MYKLIGVVLFLCICTFQLLADQSDKRLNYLFNKLVVAENEQEINKVSAPFKSISTHPNPFKPFNCIQIA